MPRTSSKEVAGILLDDPHPEGGPTRAFAKRKNCVGAAQQSWAAKRQAARGLTKILMKKLPFAECTPINFDLRSV